MVEVERGDPSEKLYELAENSQIIIDQKEEISAAFEGGVSSDTEYNSLEPIAEQLLLALSVHQDVEPGSEELVDLMNTLITAVMNLTQNHELIDNLREEGVSQDLICFLSRLSNEHGRNLQKRLYQERRGPNWWNNIKTNIGLRSGRVYLEHEISINYENTITFQSGLNNSLLLTEHMLTQILNARNAIGEDVLRDIDLDRVQMIREDLDELESQVEEYREEDIDQELSEPTSEAEGIEDE
ncbi:hypothetical protein [Haloarchaeobius sp. HME9146]|uniref:hypothetical protein n=1 Tax=Haloarchaeobius sp. HME9146 TaxID=2978732 RepID=UPI0021BF5702|nr:hypothetical protein [Haloarchaeobius sp. HME9146]MCT9095293.1 hypothetical protein [Haloarchaeobius sp. HME9146]